MYSTIKHNNDTTTSCSDNETYLCFIVEYVLNMFYCWKILVFFAFSDEYILQLVTYFVTPVFYQAPKNCEGGASRYSTSLTNFSSISLK